MTAVQALNTINLKKAFQISAFTLGICVALDTPESN
jgi:hypothetical protein